MIPMSVQSAIMRCVMLKPIWAKQSIWLQLLLRRAGSCMRQRYAQRTPLSAGNAAVKDCLEESRDQGGFTPECKQEIEAMMERRAQDVRLDSTLMEVWA